VETRESCGSTPTSIEFFRSLLVASVQLRGRGRTFRDEPVAEQGVARLS
jgi:hypothetical protein